MDRGSDADCTPLYISGSRGSLFKVRLSSHGYTLVAKGMDTIHRAFLRHENRIYDRLQSIQGKHIPVCLGSIDLVRPSYYDSGIYTHFMFLSWAGNPLLDCLDLAKQASIVEAVTATFKELHKLHVLHRDAEPRNILYDINSGKLMVVDFERAELRSRQPLGVVSPNGQSRKRKREIPQKQGKDKDDFARELESAVGSVGACGAFQAMLTAPWTTSRSRCCTVSPTLGSAHISQVSPQFRVDAIPSDYDRHHAKIGKMGIIPTQILTGHPW